MKICIVAQTFAPQEEGGAEIIARMSAIELARHHDVFVLSLGLEGDNVAPPGESIGTDGIRVTRAHWNNSYLPGPRKPAVGKLSKLKWHIRTAMGAISVDELKQLLTDEKVDLVYAHNSARMQPAIFEAASALNIPLCLHLHDYALLCPKASMFKGSRNCGRQCLECRLLTSRLKWTDGRGITAIAVSDALKRRFIENDVLPEANWHVIHNTYLRECDLSPSFSRRNRPAAGPFTFGFLGALSEEKGVEHLIEAFLTLSRQTDTRLLIAGRGQPDYEEHLKKIAADAPVEFLGFVKAQEVYDVADVVVMPSLWNEPQGMILIEAAIYGVPVIGASRGGIPEVVDGSRTGWSYDPDQHGALEERLKKAAETGKVKWWDDLDVNFPGIRSFNGTAEGSLYYERLNDILMQAREKVS